MPKPFDPANELIWIVSNTVSQNRRSHPIDVYMQSVEYFSCLKYLQDEGHEKYVIKYIESNLAYRSSVRSSVVLKVMNNKRIVFYVNNLTIVIRNYLYDKPDILRTLNNMIKYSKSI